MSLSTYRTAPLSRCTMTVGFACAFMARASSVDRDGDASRHGHEAHRPPHGGRMIRKIRNLGTSEDVGPRPMAEGRASTVSRHFCCRRSQVSSARAMWSHSRGTIDSSKRSAPSAVMTATTSWYRPKSCGNPRRTNSGLQDPVGRRLAEAAGCTPRTRRSSRPTCAHDSSHGTGPS